MFKRRDFLLALGLTPTLPWLAAASPARSDGAAHYLSACSDGQGGHYLAAIDTNGTLLFNTRLPGRAHAVISHPTDGYCVALARRPGTFLRAVDTTTGNTTAGVESPDDRHFYGHGVFSSDGRRFYASENDFDAGRGVIGVYDPAAGFRRLGELPSHGIGPHQLALMPDGTTLVVANGGIRTHPDTGRAKLNLADMAPSLAYLDRRDGRLLERTAFAPAFHQLSIRHLDVIAPDRVVVAMQHQGSRDDRVPLAALHRRGAALKPLHLPESLRRQLRQYCGSVKADRSGRWIAASAPRGNRVCFWNVGGDFHHALELRDGCGIARGERDGEFLLSSGDGTLLRYHCGERRSLTLTQHRALRWDNHLQSLAAGPA